MQDREELEFFNVKIMNKDKLLQKTDHLHVSAKDVFHSPTHDKLLLVHDILEDKEFVYLDKNK